MILVMSLVHDFAFGIPEEQNRDINMNHAHISAIATHISCSLNTLQL